jgi:hypothetical protein
VNHKRGLGLTIFGLGFPGALVSVYTRSLFGGGLFSLLTI